MAKTSAVRIPHAVSLVMALVIASCEGQEAAPLSNKTMLANSTEGQSETGARRRDGPFGIAMGQSAEDLEGKETKVGWYEISSVPKPHSMFNTVMVQATKSNGVCFVKGISDSFPSDSNGLAAIIQADKIKRQLDGKYGRSKELAFLVPGSIWNEPEDWMMAMLKGERRQAWEWAGPSTELDRHSLDSVALGITAVATDEVSLYVEYYFKNSKKCDAELEALEATAL